MISFAGMVLLSNDNPDNLLALTDVALQRYVMRVGADYFIDTATALAAMFEGNLLTALIFISTAQASVQHMNRPPQISPLALDGVFPDELRRPVSVLGLSQFLGLPYETTRRHVARLVKLGYCRKVGGKGVIIPGQVMRSPEINGLVAANFRNVCRLVRGLGHGAEALLATAPSRPGVPR